MQDELRKQYLESLPARLDSLMQLIKDLRGSDKEAEANIRQIAHSLYGSGSTFGFPEITAAGGKVEHASSADLLKELPALILLLKKVIESNGELAPDIPRILIIEDDVKLTELMRGYILNKFPEAMIDTCKNAQRAGEKVTRGSWSLIILNLILPDRDGREILKEIRQDLNMTVPVLVLTGVRKDSIKESCIALGANKILLKPVEEDVLQSVVSFLLKQNRKTAAAPDSPTLVLKGKEEQYKSADPDAINPEYAGKLVLVAEDDAVQAAVITSRLSSAGMETEHAKNGREAMLALRTKKFALIILDVQMPMLDGFEVLERIRGELALETPVIMVTAMGSEKDIIKGYDLGATDYLLKPFNQVQLVARVKTLLK